MPAGTWRVKSKAQRGLHLARQGVLARHAPDTPTSERTVRWSEGRTHVLEAGEGPHALLIHGGFGQSTDWAPILPALASRLTVHAIDRAGHGLADPFDYRGTDPRDHAPRFLEESLDALGLERTILIGHSMGGRYAVELALQRPARVEKLVLVGAPPGIVRPLPEEFRGVTKFLDLLANPLLGPIVRSRTTKRGALERVRRGQVVAATDPDRYTDAFLTSIAWNAVRNYRSLRSLARSAMDPEGMRREYLMEDRWEDLTVPTLFVWGERDMVAPVEAGRQAASRIEKGTFSEVPKAAHMPWIDSPDEVASSILTRI